MRGRLAVLTNLLSKHFLGRLGEGGRLPPHPPRFAGHLPLPGEGLLCPQPFRQSMVSTNKPEGQGVLYLAPRALF